MLKTNRAFFTLIVLLVLFATHASAAWAKPPIPKAKWTVMVYMAGDNNLEDYVVKDIEEELALTGSTADIKILALGDRSPDHNNSVDSRVDWQTTKLFYVTRGITADSSGAVEDWGEQNMGDPQTLIDFVTWSKANYPADHYALYFWGPGWNWHPGWAMRDDTDHDTLNYDELKAAIPFLGFIDMVGFDGCNMASIEIFVSFVSLWLRSRQASW